MKTLKDLTIHNISESVKEQFFISKWVDSLKGTKLTQDQLVKMLTNINDMKTLKSISDYLYDLDTKQYIAYQPADDLFVSDSKREKVVQNISEYLYKYVV